MTVGQLVKKFTQTLKEGGSPSARLDAELLACHVLKIDRAYLFTRENLEVSQQDDEILEGFVRRRFAGEPIAYIVGERDFYKDTFKVVPGVLVPRPESEIIVEQALVWLRDKKDVRILDIGCGSGCIGLSILRDFPGATLIGVDISEIPIKISQENAQKLQLEARCQFIRENVNNITPGQVDLIVANPPYLDHADPEKDLKTLNFEPKEALYSLDSGFADISAWLTKSADFLRVGGLLLMEIGADQEERAQKFLSDKKLFSTFVILRDLAGKPRTIRAVK